jgi:hypothetical protein
LIGCEGTLKRASEPGSDSKNEIAIANLAANETRNKIALYVLNYTNLPSGGTFTGIQLASGRLLTSAEGRFKFEQNSSEPTKNFYVYFNPTGSLMVVFPQLKRAFQAPAAILQTPDALPLLAACDAVRLLMGQGNVWSDPSRSQFQLRRMGGASVEKDGSPIKWNIDFEADDLLFPIKKMEAKSGGRLLLTIHRDAASFESLDYSSGRVGGIPGENVRGSQINVNTWKFEFPRSPSVTEIQLSPMNSQDAEQLLARGALDPPRIPDDFKQEEITPATLLNWLNIR